MDERRREKLEERMRKKREGRLTGKGIVEAGKEERKRGRRGRRGKEKGWRAELRAL